MFTKLNFGFTEVNAAVAIFHELKMLPLSPTFPPFLPGTAEAKVEAYA